MDLLTRARHDDIARFTTVIPFIICYIINNIRIMAIIVHRLGQKNKIRRRVIGERDLISRYDKL